MSKLVPDNYIELLLHKLRQSNLSLEKHVLKAFNDLPREYFVQSGDKNHAYIDRPLRIPSGQTISAPHMYGIMLSKEIGDPQLGMEILEIGTGSGYGAGLLGLSVGNGKVISIERHKKLVKFARENIAQTSISNVEIRHGDGTKGVPGKLFDRIFVTAAGDKLPDNLVEQLKIGGSLIIPLVNNNEQWLTIIKKNKEKQIDIKRIMRVIFVPLVFS